MKFLSLLLVAVLACSSHDVAPRPKLDSASALPVHFASFGATLDSTPPPVRVSYVMDAYNVAVAGDSLKVVLTWTQPTDGLGNADSTVSIMHISKPIRFYGDTTLRGAGTRIRRRYNTALADSFKLKKPVLSDSAVFTGDSIFQCRKGLCSVPGSWAFKYVRTAVPPPMTLLKIVHDSF